MRERKASPFIFLNAGKFEWTATSVNLNRGKDEELLSKCKPLAEYMYLINCIRDNEAKGMDIEDAIDLAVQQCIDNNILKDFLVAHRAEVIRVCLTEYNEKVYTDSIRVEGEARLGKLIQTLLAERRVDLVQLVSTDAKAREEYYAVYNIE